MDYYYYDGEKRLGPVNSAQLVALARSGGISGETIVESGGKRCRADKVPGLIPPRSESPFVVPPEDPQPVEPPPADPPPVQDSTVDPQPVEPPLIAPVVPQCYKQDKVVRIQARNLLFWARALSAFALICLTISSFVFLFGVIDMYVGGPGEKNSAILALSTGATAISVGILLEVIACACFYWLSLNGHLRR